MDILSEFYTKMCHFHAVTKFIKRIFVEIFTREREDMTDSQMIIKNMQEWGVGGVCTHF